MNRFVLSFIALAMTVTTDHLAHAQDEDSSDAGGERCINIRRIRNTTIVDDKNILFYMSGSQVYHNILPRTCTGLSREGRFSYKTSASQLCDLDNINVLMSGARGMTPGRSCGLGRFHPISPEQADALRNPEPQDIPPEKIDTAEPEEIGAESGTES